VLYINKELTKMKLKVIVDRSTRVIAATRVGDLKCENGLVIGIQVRQAGPDQTLHEIEVSDTLLRQKPDQIEQEINRLVKASITRNQ